MNDDIVQRAESMLENRLPPGTLELAVNDPAIWTQLEVAAQLCDFVPELVAEIKRLRSTYYEKKFLEAVAAKDSLNTDLMANCNQLRDRCWKAESELARWQHIAIDERAQRIISMEPEAKFNRCDLQECPRIGYICDENDGYCALNECPSKDFWRSIAAKELDLQVNYQGLKHPGFL